MIGPDDHAKKWKVKFDSLTAEKKQWLLEKKKYRAELKQKEEAIFNLQAKLKELTKTLDFA